MNKMYKERAKQSLEGKWGTAIGIIVVYGIVTGVLSQFYGIGTLFVGFPLLIGMYFFFINLVRRQGGEFDDLFEGFRNQYIENVFTIFLMNLYIALWSLLLFIPGIIKSFSYAMVPYIMADKKYKLSYNEAITESRQMMDGRKMDLFILRFSFIGWFLLGILTFGILYLWLGPYYQATEAAFYNDVVGGSQQTYQDEPANNETDFMGRNEYKEKADSNDDEWDF